MSDDHLARRWMNAITTVPGSSSLANSDHPLRLFFGSDDAGRARVVIVLSAKPGLPALGELVRVERGERTDGQWTLVLTLLDARLISVFISLTSDLLEETEAAAGEAEAMRLLLGALGDWRRLLTAKGLRELSAEALRGLCGELWVANRHFTGPRPLVDVLAAWVGPLGQPQDFAFPAGGLHEVKSVGSTSTRVKISSAEQLDAGDRDLALVLLRLPNAAADAPDSFSLISLVNDVIAELGENSPGVADLRFKLSALGVDLSRETYSTTHFVVESLSEYRVDADFPAIRADALDLGVGNVRYDLLISAMRPFLMSHTKF